MLLIAVLILGMLASLSILPSFADNEDGSAEDETDVVISDAGTQEVPEITIEEAIQAYLSKEYESSEDKLKDMKLRLTRGDYEMYVEESTGEVAVRNSKTGQIILSNPYDIYKVSSDNVKAELLSQVVVSFRDITNNNQSRTMYSYLDSAQRGQITIKNVKNGIRAEYVLGKQSAKKLMPYWMEAQRFEQLIANVIYEDMLTSDGEVSNDEQYEYLNFMSYYSLVDPNDTTQTEAFIQQLEQNYPCVKKSYYEANTSYTVVNKLGQEEERVYNAGDKMVIYVISDESAASERVTNSIESVVKSYCPEYNYEQLDYDVDLTGYTGDGAAAAIFTIAIEWYLDNDGFYFSVPTNSISYDEDTYQLDYFAVNTYLGCTNVSRGGYIFYPDGSGTLLKNEDVGSDDASYTITSEIYGPDYAYHTLFYTGKSEVITMPVYGVVDDTEYIEYGDLIEENGLLYEPLLDQYGDIVRNPDGTREYAVDEETGEKIPVYKTADASEVHAVEDGEETTVTTGYYLTSDPTQAILLEDDVYYYVEEDGATKIQDTADIYQEFIKVVPQGYFAIIEDGESLARITYSYGGIAHKYCTVYSSLRPVQSDTYNLQEAISVSDNTPWTVTSDRKYTGKFTVRYYMLSDFEGSEYSADYVSMAKVYRKYLENNGVLSLMTDTKADIPLYIEAFGKIETRDTFMTIPLWVDTPLTTFDDIKTMYTTLSQNADYSISNINFRLLGFTEDGLDDEAYPTSIKYEKVVGGNKGYNALVKDAKEKGYGVYPDFDFANVGHSKSFSGFKYSKWTVKTIDDRYSRKRSYDAIYQSFRPIGLVLVSPAYYSQIFEKFTKSFDKYEFSGLSAGTLGSDLNSDFDRKEPYNREDDKDFTADFLANLYEKYGNEMMVETGNAYTWRYVKHILGATLDSSRYLRSTTSIPFLGMVLHGYKSFAGTPTNMEGNIDYEILKIIENGAAPYFTLSYQNTNALKELYPEYYSVDFEIWLDDLIDTYRTLNEALKDVQTSRIDNHEFITANRILTESENAFLEQSRANAHDEYDAELAKAKLKYDNALIIAKRRAAEEGKEFDEEDYIKKNGEFEFMTFDEFYQDEITTIVGNYTIVYVTYENGISFVLNYNGFDISVDMNGTTYTVGSMDFVKIPKA